MQLYDQHSERFGMFQNLFWIVKHSAGVKLNDIPQLLLLTGIPATVSKP